MREVATRANISLASLSRIETNQQGLEIGLFLQLAKILNVDPTDILPEAPTENGHLDPLLRRMSVLSGKDRLELWHQLADQARSNRQNVRRSALNQLRQEVEELVAQIDFIQAQIGAVHNKLKDASPDLADEKPGQREEPVRTRRRT